MKLHASQFLIRFTGKTEAINIHRAWYLCSRPTRKSEASTFDSFPTLSYPHPPRKAEDHTCIIEYLLFVHTEEGRGPHMGTSCLSFCSHPGR